MDYPTSCQELDDLITVSSDSFTLMERLSHSFRSFEDWGRNFFLPGEEETSISYRKIRNILQVHFPQRLEVNCLGGALIARDFELANKLLDFPSFHPDPRQEGWVLDLAILRQSLSIVERLMTRELGSPLRENIVHSCHFSYRKAMGDQEPGLLATADIAAITLQDDIFDFLVSRDIWPSLETIFVSSTSHMKNQALADYPFLNSDPSSREKEIAIASEKCWYLVAIRDPYSLDYLAFFDPLAPQRCLSSQSSRTFYELVVAFEDSLIVTDKVLSYVVDQEQIYQSAFKLNAYQALTVLLVREVVSPARLQEDLRLDSFYYSFNGLESIKAHYDQAVHTINSILLHKTPDKHGYFPVSDLDLSLLQLCPFSYTFAFTSFPQ